MQLQYREPNNILTKKRSFIHLKAKIAIEQCPRVGNNKLYKIEKLNYYAYSINMYESQSILMNN